MKFQIKSIATAFAIAVACICSAKPSLAQKTVSQQAQAKPYQSPHERNTKLIDKFLKMSDEKAAFDYLRLIKNGLTEELAATKRQIQTAHQAGDTKAAEKAMQFDKELAGIYNTVVQESRNLDSFDKKAVDKTFSKYMELKP